MMRIVTLLSVFVVALAVMAGSMSARAQSKAPDGIALVPTLASVSVPSATDGVDLAPVSEGFAALNGIRAVPMASAELDAVKGLHIHFLDANGGFHFAGNPEKTHNWYLNGSPDGQPVHPSYHGLCVAGPISIPPGPNGLSQCP